MKRTFIALIVTILVIGAGTVIVFTIHRPDGVRALPAHSKVVASEAADPLTAYRTEREQLRQKHRAELNDIIHDGDTDPETLAMAQRQLMAQIQREETETTLEGLLAARGFGEAVVSATAQSVNVMVPAETLDRRQTAMILEMTLRETGVMAGNVKILAIN